MLSTRKVTEAAFSKKVRHVLLSQGIAVSLMEQDEFIERLSFSVRHRKSAPRILSTNRNSDDVIGLIQIARDSGDLDEAVWRTFLAAHFGRDSAEPTKPNQLFSALRLLCGFGSSPVWTWQHVSANSPPFRRWLVDHSVDLKMLAFGNHRKYESNTPAAIWKVIYSFITLAQEFGGPLDLVSIGPAESADSDGQFDHLYRRLSPIWHFGRTGRFDFLVLLNDLKLISIQPSSCYLRVQAAHDTERSSSAATGPSVFCQTWRTNLLND